jgi:PASTA domain-containing protein
MAIEGKVKIPLAGDVSKKTLAIAGIGGAGVVGVIIWRYRKNAAAQSAANQTAATSTPQTVTDPAGNQCAELDPDTGYCPDTPEDQAAIGSSAGYDIGAEGGDTGYGYGSYPTNTGELCPDGSYPTGYDQYGNPICPTTTEAAQISVPNVVGLSYQNAAQILTALGLSPGGSVTSGTVKSQSPAAGTEVSAGSVVTLTMNSTGTPGQPAPTGKKVPVPNVVGMRGETGKQVLTDAGFKVHQTPATTPKGKETKIASQSPRGGSSVSKGSTVETVVKTSA